jgi:hypothetical protein
MKRRAFFLTLSTAAATGATAGCLGSGNGDGNNTTSNGNTTDSGTAGQADLDAALSTLVDTDARLDELASPDTERTQSDVEDLRSQLDSAARSLDSAESASSGLSTQIGAARTVLTFQRRLADSHERGIEMQQALADQAPRDQFPDTTSGEGIPFDEGSESLTDAVDGLQTALDAVEQRRTLQSDIESAYNSLNTGPLDADELAYSSDLTSYVRYNGNALDTLVAYVEANIALLEAFAGLLRGGTQFESEQWSMAVDSFTSARDQLDATGFDDLERTAIQQLGLVGDDYIGVEAGAQLATNLGSTAGTLVDIAETAQAGNVEEAQTRFEELTSA